MFAAFGDAADHGFSYVDVEFSRCKVVEEKQGTSAARDDVVHAHRHEIDAYCIVYARDKRHIELRADSIRAAHEDRIDEATRQSAEAGEASDIRHDFRNSCGFGEFFDAFDEGISTIDVDACLAIRDRHAAGDVTSLALRKVSLLRLARRAIVLRLPRRTMVESETKRFPVIVAAGVLIERGRVLLTQRKKGSHLAGAWEFPGGKVEPGEDPRDALVRELQEEIGIDVVVEDPIEVTFHAYPEKTVLLLFFAVTRKEQSPEPRALDVAAVQWAVAEALDDARFPPADVPILAKVRRLLAGG